MWDERDHPRDEDGKFARNSRAKSKIKGLVQEKYERDMARNPKIDLSKAEWRKFYFQVMENRVNGTRVLTKSGNEIITIDHEGIQTAIIFDGDFMSPKVKVAVKFTDEEIEIMKEALEIFKTEY